MDKMDIVTRGKRIDYFVLNDGSDEEALPEDRLDSSPPYDSGDSLRNSEVFPSESASAVEPSQEIPDDASLTCQPQSSRDTDPSKSESKGWQCWDYFDITEVNRSWTLKKSNIRKAIDREIHCSVLDEKTGQQCSWKTTDSKRQSSTSNMEEHLRKRHSIEAHERPEPAKKPKSSILAYLGEREKLSPQKLLQKNILRWVVADKQPFTTIESLAFRQIFHDIPGITLPFMSRSVLRQRLADYFAAQRAHLKEELLHTCSTVALSLDVWTSKNNLPILGVIGHWLTEDFQYREKVLDFKELQGSHSGENPAAAVEGTLSELELERKLIAITGDNASNNESMISALDENLRRKHGDAVRFRGLDSYIRCLAHILNLIVQDILHALNSGNAGEACAMCDSLSNRERHSFEDQGALARLRILAIWIDRSPQRRQKWKEVCKFLDLPDKYIEYDVETRWNSTFRMLSDGLNARTQINKFLQLQSDLPMQCFSDNDWSRLQQMHDILSKFNELTLFISNKKPQISLTVPIYYELHELLEDASERSGKFSAIDKDIAAAVKNGLRKYNKYYTFMDAVDTYYTALILDPRVKGDLILQELRDDGDSGRLVLQVIRNELHLAYQVAEPALTEHPALIHGGQDDLESRMLRRLRPVDSAKVSDIDRYFDTARVIVSDTKEPNWLCDWWRRNKSEYPQMALAARDYLAIPASEVSVERMF